MSGATTAIMVGTAVAGLASTAYSARQQRNARQDASRDAQKTARLSQQQESRAPNPLAARRRRTGQAQFDTLAALPTVGAPSGAGGVPPLLGGGGTLG